MDAKYNNSGVMNWKDFFQKTSHSPPQELTFKIAADGHFPHADAILGRCFVRSGGHVQVHITKWWEDTATVIHIRDNACSYFLQRSQGRTKAWKRHLLLPMKRAHEDPCHREHQRAILELTSSHFRWGLLLKMTRTPMMMLSVTQLASTLMSFIHLKGFSLLSS